MRARSRTLGGVQRFEQPTEATAEGEDPDLAESALHPAARPMVWVAAAVWLPLRAAWRLLVRALAGYASWADRVGAMIAKGVRAVARALRELGPVALVMRIAARAWGHLKKWIVLSLLHPVGHALQHVAAWAGRRFAPVVRATGRAARQLVRRTAPLRRRLAAAVRRADAFAARLLTPPIRLVRRFAAFLASRLRAVGLAVRSAISDWTRSASRRVGGG
jgi:hypothetical protein